MPVFSHLLDIPPPRRDFKSRMRVSFLYYTLLAAFNRRADFTNDRFHPFGILLQFMLPRLTDPDYNLLIILNRFC